MLSNLPTGALAVKYGDKLVLCGGFFLQMVKLLKQKLKPPINEMHFLSFEIKRLE
jgi:hypothetical protein